MTKDYILKRIVNISNEKAAEATPIMYVAMAIITLGIVVGAILLVIGIVASSNDEDFAYIPIVAGVLYFLGNLVICFVLEGLAAIITNTHKMSEYARLQAEIIMENMFNKTNVNTEDDSLPTL